jgi:dTDP-glucose 4,6-dehydratase
MTEFSKKILITGGAGFIGSHVVRLFVKKYPNYLVLNLDALTYAGNLENLRDISSFANYEFERGNINDEQGIASLFARQQFEEVIHLAA